MKYLPIIALSLLSLSACKKNQKETSEVIEDTSEVVSDSAPDFKIIPISHATMILQWDGKNIYVDPVGGAEAFTNQPKPDIILISDIHGDHLNVETLNAVAANGAVIIAPKAVAEKIDNKLQPKVAIIENGTTTSIRTLSEFNFKAIPMYNLREEALKFHEKGRGNGYVIEKDGFRVYISGDTEDIPEMRSLKDIDVAFVCMNLPYTMTVESAASAVLDFKPKKIYPYHYRGTEGLSDVNLFADIIKKSAASEEIKVVQLDWYPSRDD